MNRTFPCLLVLVLMNACLWSAYGEGKADEWALATMIVTPEKLDTGDSVFMGLSSLSDADPKGLETSLRTLKDAIQKQPEWQRLLFARFAEMYNLAFTRNFARCGECNGTGHIGVWVKSGAGNVLTRKDCPTCGGRKGVWGQSRGLSKEELAAYAKDIHGLLGDHGWAEVNPALLWILLHTRALYMDYLDFPELEKDPAKFASQRVWFGGKVKEIRTTDNLTTASIEVKPSLYRIGTRVLVSWSAAVRVELKAKTEAVEGSFVVVFGRFGNVKQNAYVETDCMMVLDEQPNLQQLNRGK